MRKRTYKTIVCAFCGKEKTMRADNVKERNYCSISCSRKHNYQRVGKEGQPSWKGGKRVNYAGYVEVYMPEHPRSRGNGYVFEHILVMEKKLGRSITVDDNVHHIDHDKQNNNPDNLVLLTREEHSRLHGNEQPKTFKKCEVCGKDYRTKTSHLTIRKTCSKHCAGLLFREYYTGKPRDYRPTEEEKECIAKRLLLAD